MKVGLIGFPVAHSLSGTMHNAAFKAVGLNDWKYELWNTPIFELAARMKTVRESEDIAGCNVTIPHKQNVQQYLDEISPHAQAIGAVNTIYKRESKLIGDNTDWIGFLADLGFYGVDVTRLDGGALILGAGGAARAIAYALILSGMRVTIVNRSPDRATQLVSDMRRLFPEHLDGDGIYYGRSVMYLAAQRSLIVNCTSAGMWPRDNENPWPEDSPLPGESVLYDLVYKPRVTQLMEQAKTAGLQVVGGIGMLAEQGAAAFEKWTGVNSAEVSMVMREALNS